MAFVPDGVRPLAFVSGQGAAYLQDGEMVLADDEKEIPMHTSSGALDPRAVVWRVSKVLSTAGCGEQMQIRMVEGSKVEIRPGGAPESQRQNAMKMASALRKAGFLQARLNAASVHLPIG